ncbi:hypothetical protein [Caminibacter sp.]
MSIMIMPVNFFNFLDFYKLLENNPQLIEKLLKQFYFLRDELKNTLNELDKQVEKYNYNFFDENTDLEHLYEIFDLQKENLKQILNYLQTDNKIQNNDFYNLIDEIYTLTLQLEDRISTLESYRDIEKLKVTICK